MTWVQTKLVVVGTAEWSGIPGSANIVWLWTLKTVGWTYHNSFPVCTWQCDNWTDDWPWRKGLSLSHTATTDLHSDIVLWDDTSRTIMLIELTVVLSLVLMMQTSRRKTGMQICTVQSLPCHTRSWIPRSPTHVTLVTKQWWFGSPVTQLFLLQNNLWGREGLYS